MSLDVAPPDPPHLPQDRDADEYDDADVASDEYRREELQAFLDEGAWDEAFEEWAAGTEMTEDTWAIVRDLDLVERYDFFWDDFAERVGYHAPGLPEDWRQREIHPALSSWGTVSSINAGLTELGQVVCDVLQEEYIDWEAGYDAPDDLPEFE